MNPMRERIAETGIKTPIIASNGNTKDGSNGLNRPPKIEARPRKSMGSPIAARIVNLAGREKRVFSSLDRFWKPDLNCTTAKTQIRDPTK